MLNELKQASVIRLLMLLLIISIVGNFWQHQKHTHHQNNYQAKILELTTVTKPDRNDFEMELANLETLESEVKPDTSKRANQEATIRNFILSYYTFLGGDEQTRIQRSKKLVTSELLETMSNALDTNPGGSYHVSLTATNINIYQGNENEFLATFHVEYESEITRNMTQILTIKFIMSETKISNFIILSASEVFNFD